MKILCGVPGNEERVDTDVVSATPHNCILHINQLMLSSTLLDDWGLSKLMAEQRRDILEILEDRYDSRSTIVTSQLPVDKWHDTIGDPTLADAILDRLVHNAYKINLRGESMRKRKSLLTAPTSSE